MTVSTKTPPRLIRLASLTACICKTWQFSDRHVPQGDGHFGMPARAPPIITHRQLP